MTTKMMMRSCSAVSDVRSIVGQETAMMMMVVITKMMIMTKMAIIMKMPMLILLRSK